ncbi:unnamed protein product [Eretmochelys imbricata]
MLQARFQQLSSLLNAYMRLAAPATCCQWLLLHGGQDGEEAAQSCYFSMLSTFLINAFDRREMDYQPTSSKYVITGSIFFLHTQRVRYYSWAGLFFFAACTSLHFSALRLTSNVGQPNAWVQMPALDGV